MSDNKISHFKTNLDGIVTVVQELDRKDRTIYKAYWQPSFLFSMPIGTPDEVEESLEKLLDWLKNWAGSLTEIKDFGDYQLYGLYKSGRLTGVNVVVDQVYGYTEPICARDVPVGTFLAGDAVYFFKFWLGDDAVDQYDHLIKQKK